MDIVTSVSVALIVTLSEVEARQIVGDAAGFQRELRTKLRSMESWAVGPAPAKLNGRQKALPAPKAKAGAYKKERKPIERAQCPTCERVVAAFTLTNGTHVCKPVRVVSETS